MKEIPAFPSPTGNSAQDGGITIRDYFAGQALMGLCANMKYIEGISMVYGKESDKYMAISSYELSDSMLAQREVKE